MKNKKSIATILKNQIPKQHPAKLGKFMLLIAVTACIFSCKVTNYSGHAVEPNVTMNYNIDVDLEIDKSKTLQATSTTSVYFGVFKSHDKKFSDAFSTHNRVGELEKMAATYKALQGTPYDIIVNPKYIIEVQKGLFVKTITATVAGYGAKIKIK